MYFLALHDWKGCTIDDLWGGISHKYAHYFGGKLYIGITLDERDYKCKTVHDAIAKVQNANSDVRRALSVYSDVKDMKDPEAGWGAYFSCSLSKDERTDLTFCHSKIAFEKADIFDVLNEVCAIGTIGYGYAGKHKETGDARYYTQGISFGNLNDDAGIERWFYERLDTLSQIAPRRHLQGMLRDIYEINILNRNQYNALLALGDLKEEVKGIMQMGNDNFLWSVEPQNVSTLRGKLVTHNLLICP